MLCNLCCVIYAVSFMSFMMNVIYVIVIYAECGKNTFMLTVILVECQYAECHFLSVIYAECQLSRLPFMLSVIHAECLSW
jgi:hypothetical protein